MKRIIFDLDNTISFTDGGNYRNAKPKRRANFKNERI